MAEAVIPAIAAGNIHEFPEELPFEEDAKINAILLLQRRIFQLQAECLQNALQRQKGSLPVQPIFDNFVLPSILTRRNVPDEMQNQSRVLDDVEMTLLGILDSSGMLLLCSRVAEFIVVMTRAVKIEHRALCLYILSNCMTSKCGQSFITFGGLRLLKRWIKVAEEEDCVDELRIIVTLCKLLPFDGQALKDTEIGKSIRRLLKFKSTSANIEMMYTDVRNLMQHWTNHVKGVIVSKTAANDSIETSKPLPSIVPVLSKRLLQERGEPPSIIIPPVLPDTAILSEYPGKDKDIKFIEESKETKETKAFKSIDVDSDSVTVPATTTQPASARTGSGVLEALANKTNNPIVRTNNPLSVPSSSSARFGSLGGLGFGLGGLDVRTVQPTAPAKRNSTDGGNIMADKARAMLQNQLKSVSTDGLDNSNPSSLLESVAPTLSIMVPSGPLKGGLKRKYIEGSPGNGTGSSGEGKRARMSVQWADENGGTLRDVMTFEVERIKNTIKDYKSHRDLVRKERQLEKDLHLSKTKEVMHPAVEWRKPDSLVLSIDIRDNLDAPVTSEESVIQTKRLTQVLETRYVDDTLIPADPDLAPGVLTNAVGFGEVTPTKNIIWELPGEVSAPIIEPTLEVPDNSLHTPHTSQISQSQIGLNSSDSGNNDEFSQLIATLPPALRDLDRQFLQLIVQNEANVAFILNNEGEVDRGRIEQLRARLLPDSIGRNGNEDRGQYDQSNLQSNPQFRGHGSNGIAHFPPYVSGSGLPPQFHGARLGPEGPHGPGHGLGHGQRTHEEFPRDGGRLIPQQQHSGPGARKRSRFSGRDEPIQGPAPTFQEIPYRDHNVDLGPYIPDMLQNQMLPMDRHPQDMYDRDLGDRDRDRSRDILSAQEQQKKFPTTKAAVSCRFFNTRKGCQFGDKCPFGHFIEDIPAEPRGAYVPEVRNYGPRSVDPPRDGFYGSGSSRGGQGGGGGGGGGGGSRISPSNGGGKRNDRVDRSDRTDRADRGGRR